MSSLEETTREIAEDVASLSRVQNRFSKASDHQLRTIVPALIPKLFKRLEKYRGFIMNGNEDDSKHTYIDSSALSDLEEAKKKTNGIIASAMEWLRGNRSIPTEPLISSILPFLCSKNPVVATWAVAFLQVTVEKISESESSLSFTIIPPLMESLDRLHNQILQHHDRSTFNTPLEAHWIGVSWLLLDSIVLRSGKKPLLDWDMEWDRDLIIDGSSTREFGLTDDSQMKKEDESHTNFSILRETVGGWSNSSGWATQGVLSLMLDLLLYRPISSESPTNAATSLSPLGLRRMDYRMKTNNAENANDEERIFHPFDRHLDRVLPRRPTKWSDSNLAYFHYMQLACFEFAITLPSWSLSEALNNEHAMMLSILFSGHESMHRQIALSYLEKSSKENSSISFAVVTHILILIVGEDQIKPLLDSFEKQNENRSREQKVGSRSTNQYMRRPAIDWETGERAANFLLENPLEWNDYIGLNKNNSFNKTDGANDAAFATLFLDISLKLSEVNDDEHKYVSMRLVRSFFQHVKRPRVSTVCKIFDLIMTVLTILANSSFGEDLRTAPRTDDQTAAGLVPLPFGGRNDLNNLLQTHRQSLKRRNLDRGNAIRAREDAYTMIPLLSAYLFEKSDASKFRLPILLLQCAVSESRSLEKCLTKALDSTLFKYKIKFDKDQSLVTQDIGSDGMSPQHQATFILPALLEAVCSGAEYVRMNAIQWIQKLLVYMDAEAAIYLAAHLVCDENKLISQMAKSVVEKTKIESHQLVDRNKISVSFLDWNESDELIEVRIDLIRRSEELAKRLNLSSCEESMALLLHFKFSVENAEFEYRKNPHACRKQYGLTLGERSTIKTPKVDCIECGICYDEMEPENAYSLLCGHTFCKSCWVSYVTDASNDASLMNFLDLRCPHHGCSIRVLLHDLKQLEPRMIPKWNEVILRKFVEEDPSYRYCSGPDCRCVAVKSNQSTGVAPHSLKVTCTSCTTSFCFGCGKNAHSPASCQDIAHFNRLTRSSQLWVKHHSKPCPGCNVPIEKNQGCNHMQCSHCNTDFCWLCLKILNSHLEPHTCNRYDTTDSAEDDFERQALFTFTRYEAHDTAASFTLDQYKNFDAEKYLSTYWFLDEDEDIEVMENALKAVLMAREFLKNSYVAMLGLREDETRRKMHEDHHGCLELFTERLSQLTETNLHRLYTLQGLWGVRLHFRKVEFYTVSITKYKERMEFGLR